MKSILALVLLIGLSLLALRSFFLPGYYQTHDGAYHILRLHSFFKEAEFGQWPVRWLGSLNYGYGYPAGNFIYPLPYYLGLPFLSLGFSLTTTLKLLFVTSFILSAVFMFLWLKSRWGNLPAFIGALLYSYAPYRFIDIYVNGTLGVSVAFMVIALIAWRFSQLKYHSNSRNLALAALSLGLLPLAHNNSLIIFLPVIAWLFWDIRYLGWRYLISLGALAIGISAFFTLPMLPELKFTRLTDPTLAFPYYRHFPSLKQLLYSPWGYGYPQPGVAGGMSFQLGLAQWLVLGLALIFRAPLVFIILALAYLFLMQPLSQPLWQLLSPLRLVQFPWKFLAGEVFVISFLTGWLIHRLKAKSMTLALIASLILASLTVYANRNHLRWGTPTVLTDEFFLTDSRERFPYADASGELLPPWVKSQSYGSFNQAIELINGVGELTPITTTSTRLVYQVQINSPATIKINRLYFPGWQVQLDSQLIPVTTTDNGLFTADLPAGTHQLLVELNNTPIRTFGNLLTSLSLGTLIFLLARKSSVINVNAHPI